MATVLELSSRKLLASPTSEHPDAELACDALEMAAAVRGGRAAIEGATFHSARGSTYTATSFTTLCRDRLQVVQIDVQPRIVSIMPPLRRSSRLFRTRGALAAPSRTQLQRKPPRFEGETQLCKPFQPGVIGLAGRCRAGPCVRGWRCGQRRGFA
jgi:hypothetical protein